MKYEILDSVIFTSPLQLEICYRELALPVNVRLPPVRVFELLLFHDSKVYTMDSLPAHTIHQETEARSSRFIDTAASFTLTLSPVIPSLKGYNSSPVVLARLKGCESKDVSPLDSGYRSKRGSLNIRYEIQPPLNLNRDVLMRLSSCEKVRKLSV